MKDGIRSKACGILEGEPAGMRHRVLVSKLRESFPEASEKVIQWVLWNLGATSHDVYKPARGLFRHIKYREEGQEIPSPKPADIKTKVKEEDFYEPFADWLVNELEECTQAIPLGGSKFKDKWGTPDVIGVREPKKSDIVKPPTEIVAAEIKVDSSALITAFGQACSYNLFAHKSYIVIPLSAPEEDIARLDALARIFGIGLILFDTEDAGDPGFTIRVRASRREPDLFYVNKNLKIVEDDLFH